VPRTPVPSSRRRSPKRASAKPKAPRGEGRPVKGGEAADQRSNGRSPKADPAEEPDAAAAPGSDAGDGLQSKSRRRVRRGGRRRSAAKAQAAPE